MSGTPAQAKSMPANSLTDPEANANVADEAQRENSCHESNDRGRGTPIIRTKRFYFRRAEDLLFDGHCVYSLLFPSSKPVHGCILFNTLHTV